MNEKIKALHETLHAWKINQKTTIELVQEFRNFYLKSGLPEKYGQVLEGVLGRIESSSLFTEESCSFSQKDLVDALVYWLEKAELNL